MMLLRSRPPLLQRPLRGVRDLQTSHLGSTIDRSPKTLTRRVPPQSLTFSMMCHIFRESALLHLQVGSAKTHRSWVTKNAKRTSIF
jgi:hypothetical protein